MQMKIECTTQSRLTIAMIVLLCSPIVLFADADDAVPTTNELANFGPFESAQSPQQVLSGLVSREAFRVEDTTINNEVRFDWQHDEGRGSTHSLITAEIQKSVGIVTFEIQVPYIINTGLQMDAGDNPSGNDHVEGIGNIQLAARVPVYQYVSKSGFFDNSIGINFEVGVPSNSRLAKTTELAPGIFDDLAIGERFNIQALFTFDSLLGSKSARSTSFEYGLAFGYIIEDEDFALPRIERLIPILELIGETALDGPARGP